MEPSPAKRMRLSASRTSLSGRRSISGAAAPIASGLPRVASSSATQSSNRLMSTTQPTYDFISGEGNENEGSVGRNIPRPPSRQGSVTGSNATGGPAPLKRTTLRHSMLPKPESAINALSAGNMQQQNAAHQEELLALRAKVNSLEYELKNLHSERGLLALQHEKELREAGTRADSDYAKYQTAETERLKAIRAAETAAKEVDEIRDRIVNEKAALERKVREVQTKYEGVLEEKEDVEGRHSDLMREYDRFRVEEVEGKRSRLERTLAELQAELDSYKGRFETGQRRLEEREGDVERLERKVMELNDNAGGSEALEVLKRELSEQVDYVRRLETQTREQNAELRTLRDERRSVNVVEEEKRSLAVEIQVLKEAEKRAGELEIQKEILEDEKRTWTSLLEKEGGQDEHFESPEAVVKALVNERIEHALVVDRLGSVESELLGKDEVVRALQSERDMLKAEVKNASSSGGNQGEVTISDAPDSKAYKRLDRQRQLAVKEVEYLRAQLKTFDTEETVMMENANFDNQRSEQVAHLESLVDQYKSEVQSLHENLSKLESASSQPPESRGTKRAAEEAAIDDKSEQLGPLLRKNKNLQTALQNATKTSQMLATELQATKSQLKALRASKSTRILELRDNPTAQAEAIKMTTLRTLKAENQELMMQIRGGGHDLRSNNVKTVPASALDAVTLDLQASERSVAEKEKRMRRQREIWTEKAAEFRDVISSLLGYKIVFLPNGKVQVSSMYYRPKKDQARDDNEDDEEEEESNYILFDGEKGTMKISSSDESSTFRQEVEGNVNFWVKDRKEIPLFLAATSLEFYEKYGGPGTEGSNV